METLLKLLIICFTLFLLPIFFERNEMGNFLITLIILIIFILNIINKIISFLKGTFYYHDNAQIINCSKSNNIITFKYPKIRLNSNKKINVIKDIEKKCKLNKERLEIKKDFNSFDDYKIKYKLLEYKPINNNVSIPIKDLILDNINKKSEDTNIYVINNNTRLTIKLTDDKDNSTEVKKTISLVNDDDIDNNRKGVYKTIIDVFKDNKYSNDKCKRLLKSFQIITLEEKSINIYINHKELKVGDIIPMTEIRESLRKNMHCQTLDVLFFKLKYKTILDYYLNDAN